MRDGEAEALRDPGHDRREPEVAVGDMEGDEPVPTDRSEVELDGLAVAHRFHLVTAQAAADGAATSHWIVVARSPERLRPLLARDWEPLRAEPGERVWTDDFSNVLGAIDWSG